MSNRPLSVTIIGWVYVCVGCVSLAAHTWRFIGDAVDPNTPGSNAQDFVDLALVWASGLMAVVGGVFVLRGRKWARWLCVVWMGAHVVLSLWHRPLELVIHGVLFAVILFLLWRPRTSAYFRSAVGQGWGSQALER